MRRVPRHLLYVGQLIERKGIVPFVAALGRWGRRHPDEQVTLEIVGEGPDSAHLAALGLPDNVALALQWPTCAMSGWPRSTRRRACSRSRRWPMNGAWSSTKRWLRSARAGKHLQPGRGGACRGRRQWLCSGQMNRRKSTLSWTGCYALGRRTWHAWVRRARGGAVLHLEFADRMVGVSTWRRTADQPMVTAATCRPVAIRTRPPVAIEWPPIAEGRPRPGSADRPEAWVSLRLSAIRSAGRRRRPGAARRSGAARCCPGRRRWRRNRYRWRPAVRPAGWLRAVGKPSPDLHPTTSE